jgi:hypothetical protein
MPHKGQSWTPWEYEMIGEWVSRTFGDVEWRTQVRLGPIQPRLPDGTWTEEEGRMLGRWRRYVDAVVILPDRLLVVEACMMADAGKISILQLYKMLVPQTPELAEYKDLPIQMVFLYAVEDRNLSELARQQGILPVHFVPSNFESWFNKLAARAKRPPQTPQ